MDNGKREAAMALEKNAGWNFWIREGERVRLFTVADVNLRGAEEMALTETKYGVVISHGEISEAVIGLLKLPYGKVMEWTPATIEERGD
jgi:hypothetical protein